MRRGDERTELQALERTASSLTDHCLRKVRTSVHVISETWPSYESPYAKWFSLGSWPTIGVPNRYSIDAWCAQWTLCGLSQPRHTWCAGSQNCTSLTWLLKSLSRTFIERRLPNTCRGCRALRRARTNIQSFRAHSLLVHRYETSHTQPIEIFSASICFIQRVHL